MSLLLVLDSLLTSLGFAGVATGGVMLIVFSWIMWLILVGGFVSVPGPLQTVQRAELWCDILALQSSDAVHVGVDNLGVVLHVGRLLDNRYCSSPFELVTDGDLLVLIRRMLDLRGRDTVRIAKVKGHADEAIVLDGRVRDLDRIGNNAADEAADFGRRRVGPAVIDARRNFLGGLWEVVSCCS